MLVRACKCEWGQTFGMHEWRVGGAVIEGPGGLLLVQNRRDGGHVDWTPPGGVIDHGEDLLTGLTREVVEETGLVVADWAGPLYRIEVVAPDLGWHLRVEAWLALEYEGELAIDDPDGIVVDACFVAPSECMDRLDGGHPWVREPFGEWLDERWEESRHFEYRLDGAEPGSMVVTRQ